MAQKVLVQFIDDITGEPAEETVTFGLDGVSYEIDLTESNAAKLREALEPWIENGRRLGGHKQSRRRRGAVATRPGATHREQRAQRQAVRDWAKKNGYTLGERGRIPQEIQEAYLRDGK